MAALDLLGKHTLQCSRPTDCLKTYFVLRALGHAGVAAKVERAVASAQLLHDMLRAAPDFRLVCATAPPQFTNVCFWHGSDWSGFAVGEDDGLYLPRTPEAVARADRATRATRAIMLRRGNALVSYSSAPVACTAKFLRVTLCDAGADESARWASLLGEIRACAAKVC